MAFAFVKKHENEACWSIKTDFFKYDISMRDSLKNNSEAVKIELLGRDIMSGYLGEKHWAWLIKGDTFYSSIEYGQDGVIISMYEKQNGILNACRGILGDDLELRYDDTWETHLKFGQIIQIAEDMKNEPKWSKNAYQFVLNNCRDFARAFGVKLNSYFQKPSYIENKVGSLLGIPEILVGIPTVFFPRSDFFRSLRIVGILFNNNNDFTFSKRRSLV
jgi:hypothetical protein